MDKRWHEELNDRFQEHYGNDRGNKLLDKYRGSFSSGYMEDYDIDMAFSDIQNIESLSDPFPLEIKLYWISDDHGDRFLHLRIFKKGRPIPLSDILPMLENFDLRTESQRTHTIKLSHGERICISDFSVTYREEECDVEKISDLFKEAFSKTYLGIGENDGLNKLVLGAFLSWYDIILLRTFAKYLLQIGFQFSQPYIEKALVNNVLITRNLVALFKTKHDPGLLKKEELDSKIEHQILLQLESVASLDEDRIIRRILDLIKAILRTNFFQVDLAKKPFEYLAIKFNSSAIPGLPLPTPLYEIFIYSPRFEGIHLRKEKIARGGIRWSDRREDFRTEILGLMKAQVVKNTVIVPSGAKGGFVLKTLPPMASREIIQTQVVQCYQLFIRALLDLTDNIQEGKFIKPTNVVCYDDIDPYLVVAADKGTATFSDIANQISKDYNFWLGDAFASGGAQGYDHKKMGITARGAWESIKRHFRELEWDIEKKDITVVGIGDMSGDVFGNGMLYSRHIKLVGAFDHRHIFIDPNPNPSLSYDERKRLFNLPTSSWEDYNQKLISEGGGVFKRALKSITLTPQMKQIFAVEEDTLTPNEMISVLLKAPVDLLFNGGIGTYVKSSQESTMEVGDRTNDNCRVNGGELRCKVVGEGGNLGFTQRGRVEYSLNGGLIYTDFIDNSAGVDCSDHEVNLKILLSNDINSGKLTEKKRNELLASLTEEVAGLVLDDNNSQALVMSFSAFSAKKNLSLHIDYIKALETGGHLNRKVEFLPAEKELLERKAANLGLTRPELAVLLAYTKIYIKQEILKSNLPEEPYLKQLIETAFPPSIRKKYQAEMNDHRLKRDILATQLSNEVVNKMGITFIYRMETETGASVEEIIRAYTIAAHSFGINELLSLIESLDFKISMPEQFEMLHHLRKLINLSTRWFLGEKHYQGNIKELIEHYSRGIKVIERLIPNLMSGFTKNYLASLTEKFVQANLSKEIAEHIATYRAIYASLNIVDVATKYSIVLEKTAKAYFAVGDRMNLVWFRDKIAGDTREDSWTALTRLILRDELDVLQRTLTIAILKTDENEEDVQKLLDEWISKHSRIIERWETFLSLLYGSPTIEYTMFFIAIRELNRLLMEL